MKPRYIAVFTAVIAIAIATLGAAHAKAGKSTNPLYNVTSTIHNANSAGGGSLLQSENQSGLSAGAAYAASANISSFVGGPTGEYELDLSQQSASTVYLDFAVLTPNTVPVSSGYYNATIFSRCYDSNGNLVSLLTIPAKTSNNNCSLRINFSFGSFVMAPAAELPSGAPATGRASVACNASDSTGCNSWTITPYTNGANGTSADLIQSAKHGNVVVGSYSGDTFRIDLQR